MHSFSSRGRYRSQPGGGGVRQAVHRLHEQRDHREEAPSGRRPAALVLTVAHLGHELGKQHLDLGEPGGDACAQVGAGFFGEPGAQRLVLAGIRRLHQLPQKWVDEAGRGVDREERRVASAASRKLSLRWMMGRNLLLSGILLASTRPSFAAR